METELKLALDARYAGRFAHLPDLAALRPERQRLLSVYFDTPDFALLKRRVAVRLRRLPGRWVQTVKAEAAAAGLLTRRPEWEVPVDGERLDLAALPAEARSRIPEPLAQRLGPVFRTEFTRTVWLLRRGESLVEVALDRGHIRTGEHSSPLSEVEIELKAGKPADLLDLADAWLAELPFRLEPRSKAQRGYLLAGAFEAAPIKAKPPALRPDAPAGEAWRAMLGTALAQFTANCPGFEAGSDPEYLHQMRVALRRLRTAASLARPLGHKRPAWEPDLRWLLGAFSPLRDWDVLATQTLPHIGREIGQRPIAALTRPVQRARRQARQDALAAVRDARTLRMVLAIERVLIDEGEAGIGTGEWAAAALARRWNGLRRAGKDHTRLNARGRHRLRIAGKKLRYAADAFVGLHGKETKRLLRLLGKLQDVLGAANDAVVAGRLLNGLAQTDVRLARPAALVACLLKAESGSRGTDLDSIWRELLALESFT